LQDFYALSPKLFNKVYSGSYALSLEMVAGFLCSVPASEHLEKSLGIEQKKRKIKAKPQVRAVLVLYAKKQKAS
jgi:hypothetical protein